MHLIPASISSCGPSGNGKNASEPTTGLGAVLSASLARWVASLAADNLSTWPIPAPIRDPSETIEIAFDLRCAHVIHANAASLSTFFVGFGPAILDQSPMDAVIGCEFCMRKPPATERNVCHVSGLGLRPTASRRILFQRLVNVCAATFENVGATMTSKNFSPFVITFARLALTFSLSATIPPKAATGSPSQARTNASSIVLPHAAPHGFVCLITVAVGQLVFACRSRTSSSAAAASIRLL